MSRNAFHLAVADLAQSVGLLVRRSRAAASQELSWTETSVLHRLAREGPATTADLARSQGMRPQSMRTIVAALERAGMVRRRAHATDGRQVNIELSPKGAATQESARQAKRTWLAQAISQLDAEERQTLFAAGKIMKRIAESDRR